MEVIEVTARKREESLQDAPLSLVRLGRSAANWVTHGTWMKYL